MPRPQQSGLGISIHRNNYANPAVLEGNWQENRAAYAPQTSDRTLSAVTQSRDVYRNPPASSCKRELPTPSESLPAELLFSDASRPDPRQFGTISALSFRHPSGPQVSTESAADCRRALSEPEVKCGRVSLVAAKRAEWARERGVVVNAAPRPGATASAAGAALLAQSQAPPPSSASFSSSNPADVLSRSLRGSEDGDEASVRPSTFIGVHACGGVLQGPGALPGAGVNRHGLPGGRLADAAGPSRHPFGYALPSNQPVAPDRKTAPWSASGYGLGFTDDDAAKGEAAIGPVGYTQLGASPTRPAPGTAPLPQLVTSYVSENMCSYGPGLRQSTATAATVGHKEEGKLSWQGDVPATLAGSPTAPAEREEA